ncbi:MAG: Gfo/Idh/MocA family oxidoreductase [Rhodocyclaceae bacterium]|nr:Gfo/Idh/MocA family oxidoreductase [Rhodocyclaceae bacterium]
MNRRNFLTTTAGVTALLANGVDLAHAATKDKLRVGVIGTGLRGQVHIGELLKRSDVTIAAICDLEPAMLKAALKLCDAAGHPAPTVYTGSERAWEGMLVKAKLDAVLVVTPWEWHAPMAIAAMEARVAVGCEVVAGITMEDHWNVLRTQQRTGTPYMLLENVCYRRDVMAVLNMVRQNVFGEIMHVQGGYQHDLRGVKFNSGNPALPYERGAEFGAKGWSEARWRTAHSVTRNGDLYPSHGIGPAAMWLNIHRGNRFTKLNSFATKARGLSEYAKEVGGADHPSVKTTFALGDVVTTQIACANGETVLLQHDTNLPRPYSLGFRVQGTRGIWMDVNKSIYIEGKSPAAHRWEPALAWLDKYDHPLWKKYAGKAEGAGHGGMDFFVIHAFVEALKADAPMPIDIYDAIAWSAITPLSEQSIKEGNRTVEFPDFTAGAWKGRKPMFALGDSY